MGTGDNLDAVSIPRAGRYSGVRCLGYRHLAQNLQLWGTRFDFGNKTQIGTCTMTVGH